MIIVFLLIIDLENKLTALDKNDINIVLES